MLHDDSFVLFKCGMAGIQTQDFVPYPIRKQLIAIEYQADMLIVTSTMLQAEAAVLG